METTDIIGKGKDFEPPFIIGSETPLGTWLIDSKGKCVAMLPQGAEKTANHLCDFMNREHEGNSIHVQEQRWHYGRRFLITTEGASAHLEIYDPPCDDGVAAYFGSLWVEPAYRRKGVARRILRAAEDIAKSNGQDAVWLEWREADTPVEIARWYEREGYDVKKFSRGHALYKKGLKGGGK